MTTFPFPVIWELATDDWLHLGPLVQRDRIFARCGKRLLAADRATGALLWDVEVDQRAGAGRVLHVLDDVVITDQQLKSDLSTELRIVRDGVIVKTWPLRTVVEKGGTVLVGGRLHVVGLDSASGRGVMRAIDLDTGELVVDVLLGSGAATVAPIPDGFVILNRPGVPGLFRIDGGGGERKTLAEGPAQEMRAAGGRVLVALRPGEGSQRTMQLLEGPDLAPRWSAPARTAVMALDHEVAVHLEDDPTRAIPVLREASDGSVRWRGESLSRDPGEIHLAGPLVVFRYGTKMMAVRRDDGTPVGEIPLGCTAVSVDDRIYVGGFQYLACATI